MYKHALPSPHIGTAPAAALVKLSWTTVATALEARLACSSTSSVTAVAPVVGRLLRTAVCATTPPHPPALSASATVLGSVLDQLKWTCAMCVMVEVA